MSCGEKLEKIVVKRLKNGTPIPAMWVQFLEKVKELNGTGKRSEIMRSLSYGNWYPQISTNVWAALVKNGFIIKNRQGRSFTYSLSESGFRKLLDAKNYIRTEEIIGFF